MTKFLFIILTLFISIPIFAKKSNLEYYKPIYFIYGDKSDQCKVQLSFKYNLGTIVNNRVYFGYSQYIFWDAYEKSGPLREVNYNPEVFYLINNPKPYIDFIQLSFFEHISNGKGEDDTRGVNNIYGRIQTSTQTKVSLGLNLQTWYAYMDSAKNEDYLHYAGNNSIKVFLQLREKSDNYITNKEEIYFKISTFLWKEMKLCTYEAGIKFRIVTGFIKPYFFINIKGGYYESLIDYNKQYRALRGGLILNY